LGHSGRYRLISLHYLRHSIATVERREASVPGAAQTPAAGTKNTALFDIVRDIGQRFVRAPPISRVPGERSETPISGLPEIGS
jgi:hypothetical protein